jgi:hypothetical protein
MSKRNVATPVSIKTIRTAFQDGTLDATKVVDSKGNPVNANSVLGRDGDVSRVRGRIHPAFVAAYVEANPGSVYAEKSAVEQSTITLPVTKTSKSGATLARPVEVPLSEFRRLSGQAMGRPSAAAKATAADAYKAENGLS